MKLPNRYESLQQIGKGLSGEVYRAYDRETKRWVALKVFVGDAQKNRDVFNYFVHEVKLLRRITDHRRHPHIIEYIDDNLVKPSFYVATALVDGCSLETQVSGRPQPTWLVVSVVEQIGSALDYLHHGHPQLSPIVHRDIKPQNILLHKNYDAVLIDFSIASFPGFGMADEKNLGTPGYMAPEQYEGPGAERPASDQFALAMVALYMLTGKRPSFQTKTAVKQIERWKETEYTEIRQWLGDKRQRMAEVLIKALAYDPEKRYASCEEFADALRSAAKADGEVVTRPPDVKPIPSYTDLEQANRPSVFSAAWILLAVIVVLSLVMMVIGLSSTSTSTSSAVNTPTSVPTLAPSPTMVGGTSPPFSGEVSPTPTLATLPQPPTLAPIEQNVVVMLRREPLRAGPSTDTRIILWMPENAIAQRTGREERTGSLIWYEVTFEGQVGWCRSIQCQPK
jgi:serine/threonine-protein kinase